MVSPAGLPVFQQQVVQNEQAQLHRVLKMVKTFSLLLSLLLALLLFMSINSCLFVQTNVMATAFAMAEEPPLLVLVSYQSLQVELVL